MESIVLRIMELALAAKKRGADVFVKYSPHINGVDVSVFPDGWKREEDSLTKFQFYTGSDAGSLRRAADCIECLEGLCNER